MNRLERPASVVFDGSLGAIGVAIGNCSRMTVSLFNENKQPTVATVRCLIGHKVSAKGKRSGWARSCGRCRVERLSYCSSRLPSGPRDSGSAKDQRSGMSRSCGCCPAERLSHWSSRLPSGFRDLNLGNRRITQRWRRTRTPASRAPWPLSSVVIRPCANR